MSEIDINNVQNWIKGIINDPLAKILSKNSQLTEIQLETLLIDLLSERLLDRKISNEAKSMLRIENKKISRGSFNRTLQQAKKNMTSSILTVLLLGYIGVLDSPDLSPFLETSNKLKNYIQDYNTMKIKSKNDSKNEYMNKIMIILQENLKNEIISLITHKNVF